MAGEALGTPRSDNDIVSLGMKNGLEMAILVRTAKTLGKIILKPDSMDLIDGVLIEPLAVHPDDRGFFMGRGVCARRQHPSSTGRRGP